MSVTRDDLRRVAEALGQNREHVVFVGGSVLALVVANPVGPAPRPTKDVDFVVEAATRRRWYAVAEELEKLGFKVDTGQDAPICRYVLDGRIKVDIMPTDSSVLGFANRWLQAALNHAEVRDIGEGLKIRVPTRPVFMAMKLEAFRLRGKGDYQASHDLEDVISLVDGTPQIVEEIEQGPEDVSRYLAATVGRMLGERRFIESIPGHLNGDPASQARLPLVMERLRQTAAL